MISSGINLDWFIGDRQEVRLKGKITPFQNFQGVGIDFITGRPRAMCEFTVDN